MKAARQIFIIAAVYGFAVLVPGLFVERGTGPLFSGIAQPEYYFGFYGLALAWQGVLLVIARDPVRFRPLMLLAALEKAMFFAIGLVLWQAGQLSPDSGPFIGAMIDGLLMLAFLVAWWLTPRRRLSGPSLR